MTGRLRDKLDFILTRSFYEIEENFGNDPFRLKVPLAWKGSAVFHADRLRRYPNDPFPGQEAENLEPKIPAMA